MKGYVKAALHPTEARRKVRETQPQSQVELHRLLFILAQPLTSCDSTNRCAYLWNFKPLCPSMALGNLVSAFFFVFKD